MQTFKTGDAYLKTLPKESAAILGKLRRIIQKASPEAVESISYEMPAFKLNGIVLYYAAFDKHIGIYPYPSTLIRFKKELAKYSSGKSTIKIPHEEKFPTALIEKIIKARIKEKKEQGKK